MSIFCTCTITEYENGKIKQTVDGKTARTEKITPVQYRSYIAPDYFFLCTGGRERRTKKHTPAGYLVTRINRTTRDKKNVFVHEFSFEIVNEAQEI